MTVSYWRVQFRPIIARILREYAGRPKSEQNAALRAAFPAGPRSHHPYKMWLKEIRSQRGLIREWKPKTPIVPMPGQLDFLPVTEQAEAAS